MAIFAWVGGSTGATGNYQNPLGSAAFFATRPRELNFNWIMALDWNNPSNWRKKITRANATEWVHTSKCPGPNDVAQFGPSDAVVGNGYGMLPVATSPCLFGGASAGAGATVHWRSAVEGGSNFVGTTFDSSLESLVIGSNALRPRVWSKGHSLYSNIPDGTIIDPNSQYPFAYIGGGLFGATAPMINPNNPSETYYSTIVRFTDALENAARNGFILNQNIWGLSGPSGEWGYGYTYGGSGGASMGMGISYGSPAYWNNLLWPIFGRVVALNGSDGTGGTQRLTKITLKTKGVIANSNSPTNPIGFTYNQRWQGYVQVEALKDYTVIPGVSGASATTFVGTYASVSGVPEYDFSGHFNMIYRIPLEDKRWLDNNWNEYFPTTYYPPVNNGDYNQSNPYADVISATTPRKHLTLSGATCGTLNVAGPGWLGYVHAKKNSNIAYSAFDVVNTPRILLQNRFDRFKVFQDLGIGTEGLSAETNPQLSVVCGHTSGYDTSNWVPSNPYSGIYTFFQPGVIIGRLDYTDTYLETSFNVLDSAVLRCDLLQQYPNYLNCVFLPGIKINSMSLENGSASMGEDNVSAPSLYGSPIAIGTLRLSKFSQLKFRNGWTTGFGIKTGNIVEGGIVFDDETCTAFTAPGVRLFNDQIETSNFRMGTTRRQGKTTATLKATVAPELS